MYMVHEQNIYVRTYVYNISWAMCTNEALTKIRYAFIAASFYLFDFHNSVATGSAHPDYPGHLGHFLSWSKWVSPGHTYMPDPDQNYLVITCIRTAIKKDRYSLIEQSP